MLEPRTKQEYLERFHTNQQIFGTGFETGMEIPCPFCAAPGFLRYKIIDAREAMERDSTCSACGRSAKALFRDLPGGGVEFEMVQTGGPPQPDWLTPHMRRLEEVGT